MAGFRKVDGVNMTDDEVCELLCNSEGITYDSTDSSDSDENDVQVTNPCKKKPELQVATRMLLIQDENNTESDSEDEIDIEGSIHDSFIQMINDDNDHEVPAVADLGRYEPLDLTPSTSKAKTNTTYGPTNIWSSFSSEFSGVYVNHKSSEFERVLWKKGHLQFDAKQVQFGGDSDLTEDIKALQTPFKIWCHLFPQSLEEEIVMETLKYAGVNQSFSFAVPDLRKFIGVLFYMTYYKLPNTRDYWSANNNRSVHMIQSQMPMKRFEKIRELLHFNDKSKMPDQNDPNRDRLYLIRPVMDTLNRTFSTVPKLDRLSVDEQMCSTKIGSYMKQYLPNKPKKWGFKLFVLCDTMGYAYKFELYSGATEKLAHGEPDLQSLANIVVRLLREVPRYQNFVVYFDNFYSTVPLIVYLRTQGILAVGTIRRNRIKNCKLREEKIMMKFERGAGQEFVANIHGIELTTLSCKDNRIVNLISNYVGTKPPLDIYNTESEPLTIKRFDKKEKSIKSIPCPQIIKDYNCHMGGVDLMDSSIGRHKISMKSRKWTTRIFYHLLDMTCVNALILYRRINKDKPGAEMRLVDVKLEVADALFSYNTKTVPVRGRPNLEKQIEEKRRKPNTYPAPPKDTRLDETSHWITMEKKGRCKLATKSQEVPDLSKSFASTHLSKLYESLPNVPTSEVKYALSCIEICLRLYPGSSGSSRGIIERFISKFLDCLDYKVVVSCGKCLHLLQQVRGGGVQGVNHKTQWKNYQIQLLGSIHAVYNEMFAKCTEIYDDNIVEDQLPLSKELLVFDHEPVKRAAQLYTRCNNLIHYLIIALREPFPVEKPIVLKRILNVINRGLSVTCIMLEQNPIADNFAIGLLLPKLHIDLLELLNAVIVNLRGYLRPHSQLILGLLIDTLKWTSSTNVYGNQKPLLKLRTNAYYTIRLWCKVLHSGSRCDSIAEYLCNEIMSDVTPTQSEFTLKVLSGARKHMSKKARRQLHKAQNEQSKLAQTHSNDNSIRNGNNSDERNQIVCISALRCLQEVLLSVANFLKPTTIKLLQTNITQICATLYELTIKPTHLYHNYQCRIEIYNTLCVMLMSPHNLCPPPTELVLTIIQTAHVRDGSFKVRSHCGFILQNLEKIIHPQKESLLFLVEARDIRNTFIKMGQESLLHTAAINFTNTNDVNGKGHHENELVDKTFESEISIVQEGSEEYVNGIGVDMNDVTDNISMTKTDHPDLKIQVSEEECHSLDRDLTTSEIENHSKSPDLVLLVDDDVVEEIGGIVEETINDQVVFSEPVTKKLKLQDENQGDDDDVCIIETKVPGSTNIATDGDGNNIEVDDDQLLADIASQFVDELN